MASWCSFGPRVAINGTFIYDPDLSGIFLFKEPSETFRILIEAKLSE